MEWISYTYRHIDPHTQSIWFTLMKWRLSGNSKKCCFLKRISKFCMTSLILPSLCKWSICQMHLSFFMQSWWVSSMSNYLSLVIECFLVQNMIYFFNREHPPFLKFCVHKETWPRYEWIKRTPISPFMTYLWSKFDEITLYFLLIPS